MKQLLDLRIVVVALTLALQLLLSTPTANAEPRLKLMAISNFGTILELDWNTGRAIHIYSKHFQVGPLSTRFFGITTSVDGTLFVNGISPFSSGTTYYKYYNLDPGSLDVVDFRQHSDSFGDIFVPEFDLDPISGQLYGVVSNGLATFNPDTVRIIEQIPIPSVLFSALAFSLDGAPYVFDASANRLWKIDKTSGSTLSSTLISVDTTGGIRGMDFHPQSGTLYAMFGNRLYTLDPATGAASLVGSSQFPTSAISITGLTFVEVPEASSFVLLACVFGAVTLTVRRR